MSALALRSALDRYEEDPSAEALDAAFSAAAWAVAELRGDRARTLPGIDEIRMLFAELPEFEQLVEMAVAMTEQSVHAAGRRLWTRFGLTSEPPCWDPGERSRARLLVACACARLDGKAVRWLGPRLLSLASERWAERLVAELARGDEELWRRVLGERYESVWRRYALRGAWRSRLLSDLVGRDGEVAGALKRRMSRWLAGGAQLERLADEVEAALVETRTPHRLA